VSAHRYRWGGLAWLLTLQFFVVEAVVAARTGGAYSRVDDVISLLGSRASPAPGLMNASFVAQGVLVAVGAALLFPALSGLAGRMAPVLLGASAVGVALVGFFPLDGVSAVHYAGATLHFLGAGLGLVALAYALRPRSEAVGTTLALLGLVTLAATVFYGAGVVDLLGPGGTERAAAYPLPIGLALAGGLLWRQKDSWTGPGRDGRPSRAELRARERAAAQRRAVERDLALEEAARRAEAGRSAPGAPAGSSSQGAWPDTPATLGSPVTPGGPGAQGTPVPAAEDDDFDPDDPWASPRRP
jgi:hypothetical membrane protein